MNRCTFCDILASRLPSSIVAEDETCTAFMDIQPINPGHVLIIPNHHVAHLVDLTPDCAAHLFRLAQQIAQALPKSGLPCDGINLFLADGEVAGQDVFHVHLHVIPRYAGDGFGLRLGPHYGNRPDRAELDMAAEAIRNAL